MGPVPEIALLGGMRVVLDGRCIGEGDWPTRRALELVALLALSPGRRLVRDQVIEQLWPHLDGDAGAANLRKAAHHARRTLGDPQAVVLKGGTVELLPGRQSRVDVDVFLAAADEALRDTDPWGCATVAATVTGDLLPTVPFETWTQEPRRLVQARRAALLRAAGDHEGLLAIDPTDEAAARELMGAALDSGRRHVAIRWYEQLRLALVRELGAAPAPETRELYERCTRGIRLGEAAFVGRALELAQIAGVRQEVGPAAGAAVLLRGPAGIGKSALCREASARAREDGWRVLTVTGVASAAPYTPLASAVEQLLTVGGNALAALPERTHSVLAEISPAAGPAPPLPGALTRHQVIAALRRLLALKPAPTLLLVEDAHRCDEATADVLYQLVTGGAGVSLTMLLAVRAEWLRTSLPHGIADLARANATTTLDLAPLADAEVVELLSGGPEPPPGSVVDEVVQAADGSPFFALELARARASGAAPESIRAAVAERFAGLDSATLDAVAALALHEDELDLTNVLALTGGAEAEAFALLDAALDAGILVVAGTRYRFRHELVRQALTDGLAPHRRVALHREVAERLERAGAAPELIARHWLRGERAAAAVPSLLQGSRNAVEAGAFADALVHVDRLLREDPAHREALVLRAEVLDGLGDAGAPDAYAAAANVVGEPEATELRARQALAQLKASDPASALATLDGLQPQSIVGRLAEALTYSAAAAIGFYGDTAFAATKADEAHRLALELGDPGFILDATWAHALAAHAKGELPARLREYLRATRHLPEIATRVFDGQLCVTERMLYGGLPNAEIIAFADGLAEEAQRIGAARGHAFARTLRGEAGILAGHLDEADADFAAGARLHGTIGAAAGEALSLLGRGQVATYRGRPEHAQPFLADALLMARESEVGHHTLDRIYGAMVDAAPDPQAALELVCEAETAIRGPAETCPTCRIAFIVPATIASARAGDIERAHRYAADCEKALEIVALPPAWHAAVAEARGWLARAEGRDDDAHEQFAHATEGFTAWGQPLDAERCAGMATA